MDIPRVQDLKLRTDADPVQLLKELVLYPLVYTRPLGIVSVCVRTNRHIGLN